MKPTRFVVKIIVSALAMMTCGWSQPCIVAAQTTVPTVGVLTPGLIFGPVLEGLREGLEKLGYKEEQNIRFMIEDSQGDLSGLASRAAKLRVNLVRREATTRAEVEKVLAAIGKDSVDAIYFIPSIVIGAQFDLFLKKSREDKLPFVAAEATWVEKGALFSYAADFRLVGAQAGRLVAKVLKGEKPSDIPTETPEKLLFVVNMATARSIGLKIPRNVLERIDRIVE